MRAQDARRVFALGHAIQALVGSGTGRNEGIQSAPGATPNALGLKPFPPSSVGLQHVLD